MLQMVPDQKEPPQKKEEGKKETLMDHYVEIKHDFERLWSTFKLIKPGNRLGL